jgi:hypothetical protein
VQGGWLPRGTVAWKLRMAFHNRDQWDDPLQEQNCESDQMLVTFHIHDGESVGRCLDPDEPAHTTGLKSRRAGNQVARIDQPKMKDIGLGINCDTTATK